MLMIVWPFISLFLYLNKLRPLKAVKKVRRNCSIEIHLEAICDFLYQRFLFGFLCIIRYLALDMLSIGQQKLLHRWRPRKRHQLVILRNELPIVDEQNFQLVWYNKSNLWSFETLLGKFLPSCETN